MAAKKSLTERFMGKGVKMLTGEEAVVVKIIEKPGTEPSVVLSTKEGNIQIMVLEIEARGGKFFQSTTQEAKTQMENDKTETEVGTKTAPVPEGEEGATESVTTLVEQTIKSPSLSPEQVKAIVKAIGDKPVVLTCQFCQHEYRANDGGCEKPNDPVDICPACFSLAEDRLLKAGLDGVDVTIEAISDYLARFYGLVSEVALSITVNNKKTKGATDQLVAKIQQAMENPEPVLLTEEEAYIQSRAAIARSMIANINSMSLTEEPEIVEENEEAVTIKFSNFLFKLSALCGGYLCDTQGVQDDQFISLDDLFVMFTEESTDEDDSDEDIVETLDTTAFYRLQNCKDTANNKKLVKIVDVILPEEGSEEPVKYRVVDKEGKKYKVVESKLRLSQKSF